MRANKNTKIQTIQELRLFEGKSYRGVPMILSTNWLAIIDQEKHGCLNHFMSSLSPGLSQGNLRPLNIINSQPNAEALGGSLCFGAGNSVAYRS